MISDYINSRIISRFSDGGRYFRGTYDDAALQYIEDFRKSFPFSDKVDHTYYTDRTRQRYLLMKDKFNSQIGGSILDVGSRDDTAQNILGKKCTLIDKNNTNLDSWDWEKDLIPFGDKSFDTVLCLDTLEHINDIHRSFADLMRVTRKTLIISLPNCWKKSAKRLVAGYGSGASYGLPPEKPFDRHKWFFNTEDVDNFIAYNAYKHGFSVSDIVYHMPETIVRNKILFPIAKRLLPTHSKNLLTETIIVSLKRNS